MNQSDELKLKEQLMTFFEKIFDAKDEDELDSFLDNRKKYIQTPLVHITLDMLSYMKMKQNGLFEEIIFPHGGDNGVSLMYELIEKHKFEEFAFIYDVSKSYPTCFRYNRDKNDKAIKTFRKKDLMIATIRLLDRNKNFTVEEMKKTFDLSIISLLSDSLHEYRKHFFLINLYQCEFERKNASNKDLEFTDEKYIHSLSELKIILDNFQKDYNHAFFTKHELVLRELQNGISERINKKDF